MNRRTVFAVATLSYILFVSIGCRGHQFGHIVNDDQKDMVGSHTAGAAAFNPLIDESVGKLLGRQHFSPETAEGFAPKRICFVGIENHSAEEIGDFKEQIYEQIDSKISESRSFQQVSRRYVDAALERTRLRPDSLFLPENMQILSATLAQQGQPFDYLLFAKLTSGTTEKNSNYQRDYLLTLEMVNVNTGDFDKESATIRKGYHKTRIGKLRNYNPFTRR